VPATKRMTDDALVAAITKAIAADRAWRRRGRVLIVRCAPLAPCRRATSDSALRTRRRSPHADARDVTHPEHPSPDVGAGARR
jgi:hypothetical protein